MVDHSVSVVNDDDADGDLRAFSNLDFNMNSSSKTEFDDPFLQSWDQLQKLDGLSANFRRKVNRMEKSFTGVDGAKSKKLDPLDLTGYSLFQIVQPPYNVLYLSQLFEVSPYHHAAVNAKVANDNNRFFAGRGFASAAA